MPVQIVCPKCLSEFNQTNSRACSQCNVEWELVKGISYFGKILAENANDLIELLSSSDRLNAQDYTAFDYAPTLENIREFYEGVITKSELFDRNFGGQEPFWWRSRWQEFLEFEYLTDDLDIQGKKLLDVGAGYGSDAERYQKLGAEITAFEYSPAMFLIGAKLHPNFQWIGGDASSLPFNDEAFDFVVAHHSLHHHHSFKDSLAEMIRVLKIGGKIITMGDPYTMNRLSEEEECTIFNEHEGVLSGINEKVLNFSDLQSFIDKYKDQLKGFFLICESGTDDYQRVSIDRLETIQFKSFSLALSAEKVAKVAKYNRSLNLSAKTLDIGVYVDTFMEQSSSAPLFIANILPIKFLNINIKGTESPKFMLLNGWHLYQGHEYRDTSAKWRYFTSSNISEVKIKLKVQAKCITSKIDIVVNGIQDHYQIIPVGELLEFTVDFSKFSIGGNHVIEIEIHCCGLEHKNGAAIKSKVYELSLA